MLILLRFKFDIKSFLQEKYEITWNSDAFQPDYNSQNTEATISDIQQSGWIRVTVAGITFNKTIVGHVIVSGNT